MTLRITMDYFNNTKQKVILYLKRLIAIMIYIRNYT